MYRDPEADFACADCCREAARLHTVAGRLVCEPACQPAQEPRRAADRTSQLPASTPGAAAAGRPAERDEAAPMG